jgi:amino acid adenylation domain-containing protein
LSGEKFANTMRPVTTDGLSPAKRALLERTLRGRRASPADIAIQRRAAGPSVPLSLAQEQIWFVELLNPGSIAYNVPFSFHLRGLLDAEALEWSLSEVVRRHEPLRTRFGTSEGMPTATVEEINRIALSVSELSNLPESDQAERVAQLTRDEIERPFDLGRPPLFRARLLRLSWEEHRLIVVMHHIASDGGSVKVVCREVSQLYTSSINRAPVGLPPLAITYSDYAAWQRERLGTPAMEPHATYWRKHLAGAPLVLELPADRQRPSVQTHRGDHLHRLLPARLSHRLRALSRSNGVSMFMTLLAAFEVLIYRLTGQAEAVVGVPVGGRNRPELEPLVGLFINMLGLRADVRGNPTFQELLARVRQTALSGLAHQDLAFERLVEVMQPARDTSRSPIFQVQFNMSGFGDFRLEMPGLQAEYQRDNLPGAALDLTLYANDSEEQVDLTARYSSDLFEPNRIAELLAQMEHLLQQVADAPAQHVDQLSLVTPGAAHVLPEPTACLMRDRNEPCVDAMVAEQACRAPARVAVVDAEVSLTYDQLEARSQLVAGRLAAAGVGRGDVVAVHSERGVPFVVALLGVLKAGAAFAVIDATNPPTRLIQHVEACAPAAWIDATAGVPAQLRDHVGGLSLRCALTMRRDGSIAGKASSRQPPPATRSADDLAYIAFTSGSTGPPRAVAGTHRPLAHFLRWHIETFALGQQDRFCFLSGLAHDPALRDVFTPLWLGATLVIPPPHFLRSPNDLLPWMREQRVTVVHLTPSHGRLLAEALASRADSPNLLSDLRWAFFGGEALLGSDASSMGRLAPKATIVNFYGTTETPQAMAYFVCESKAETAERIPLGQGIADVQLLLRNRGGRLAGIGELAEIQVRTPYLTLGYLGDQAETARRFLPDTDGTGNHWVYATGDLGRYLPGGDIEFVGRSDQQVNVRGNRIELGDVEATLALHPGLKAAAAAWRTRPAGEAGVVGYCAPQEQPGPTAAELRAFLRERLPEHMIPAVFVTVDSLPLTANGKVDKDALPAPDWAANRPDRVAPQTPAQEMMAAIWSKALGLPEVAIHDDFFELGGHSLMAVRVMAEIEKAFGRQPPLAAFFQDGTTVAGLVAVMERAQDEDSSPLLVPARLSGALAPLFFVFSDESALLTLRHFLSCLGPDQPVYGMLPERVRRRFDRSRSVENLARGLVTVIRGVQPDGPYYLCGHSLGGVLAYEITLQLSEIGQRVAFLGILDAMTPAATKRWLEAWMNPRARLNRQLERGFWDGLSKLWEVADREARAALTRVMGTTTSVAPDEYDHDGSIAVGLKYRPRPHGGAVTLFTTEASRTAAGSSRLGWEELTGAGHVDCHEVPGDHLSMLKEPHVGELAGTLARALDGVQQESPVFARFAR